MTNFRFIQAPELKKTLVNVTSQTLRYLRGRKFQKKKKEKVKKVMVRIPPTEKKKKVETADYMCGFY